MSEPTQPMPGPSEPPSIPAAQTGPPAPKTSTWKYTLGLVVLALAAGGGWYAYTMQANPVPPPPDELQALKFYIQHISKTQSLAPQYTDANGDLVADAPTDPAKFLKVDEIVFSVVGTDNPQDAEKVWKDFMAALAAATGDKVKVRYASGIGSVQDQVKAVAEGRLHVTAFNTGQVSTAVNTAGFVPLFCPADKAGKYAYQMEILVRADSPIQKPEDLKGKTVGFVAMSSNSGGKAPIVLLKDTFGMYPGRDYRYTVSGDHIRGMKDMLAGRFDAACVANDLLAREVAKGELQPSNFRSIYKSDSFPPLCFGVPHNLPPELLAQVKQTFTKFSFDGNSVGEFYKGRGPVKFAPVNYKDDWKLTREVDDSLTRLLDTK
ncbi:MAG: phosphate/phosphite/phosphonate ABC transporter substrate-binding protein [Gemmataceae bacterium]